MFSLAARLVSPVALARRASPLARERPARSTARRPARSGRQKRPQSLGRRKGNARVAASHNSSARDSPRQKRSRAGGLALSRLVALLRLVDNVDTALAAHQAVVAMAVAQRFQRITDFHDITKGSTRGAEPTADKLKRRSYASNGRRDQGRPNKVRSPLGPPSTADARQGWERAGSSPARHRRGCSGQPQRPLQPRL
jgi:hypothetical protein